MRREPPGRRPGWSGRAVVEQTVTMSLCMGPSAFSSSDFSASGTSKWSSDATRSSTRALKSATEMPRPA
jgi:hypothetical protein